MIDKKTELKNYSLKLCLHNSKNTLNSNKNLCSCKINGYFLSQNIDIMKLIQLCDILCLQSFQNVFVTTAETLRFS